MSRLVWFAAWVTVGLWSLVCAATYGVFDLVGRLLQRNADAFATDPEVVEGIWRFLHAVHGLSTGAVLVAWAVVSLAILAVPWLLDRLVGRSGGAPGGRPFAPSGASTDGSLIDLAPDQYSVAPARPSGPVPRIDPRRR